jgi:hypothetical protein
MRRSRLSYRRGVFLIPRKRLEEETAMEGSPLGIGEEAIKEDIDSLTSSGTKGRSRPKSPPLNMILTDLPGSLCFTMSMERNDISLPQVNFG